MPAGSSRWKSSAHFRRSPLTEPWEPLFSRKEARKVVMGLHVREAHCNSRGLLHGGLIAALADNAIRCRAAGPVSVNNVVSTLFARCRLSTP